ncbi:class I SAM-dependent methyltransferase [Streptococcus ictaluri]|uniref:Methyltransferase domain protein n=1 Tax=Streptococcus ictaluri 707-05 TaxID=764299 RepID=G5K350_9STRE|nr:methyltransferase domain-containing protein [Streptococcus ictaluri]EHI69508.1 methyltransferase domain protein [Streptococcus ictaluri 707-05]
MYKNWWNGDGGDQGMEDSHQTAWKHVITLLDSNDIKNRNVLDFGCNQGGFLRVLYDNVPFKKGAGIAIAINAIATAQERVGDYPIIYKVSGTPNIFDYKFDTVISTSVLYLIEDLEEHISLISDCLSPNGVYYASFADQSQNPSLDYMKEQIDQYGSTRMQVKTLTEVVDTFLSHGFSVNS